MSIDELLKQTTPRPWRAVNGMDRWRVESADFYICAMSDNGRSGELDAELICLAVNAFCTHFAGDGSRREAERPSSIGLSDSTQATKAHDLYRDLPFMLEEWQETILRERIADLLREHEELAIRGVMRIRCLNHVTIPQQNANEFNGGECGACIAEERDALKAKSGGR